MANTKTRLITVNKSGAGALTNYSHLVTADTTGWSAMDTLGDDVRFYDAGHNLLNHWVVPIDYATIKNANTSFLVRIPTVAASGDTLLTLEYGDGALTNVESGTNAFNVGGAGTPGFFDDFTTGGGAGLNGTRWPSQTGTWTEVDGPPKSAQCTDSSFSYPTATAGVTISKGFRMITKVKATTIESASNEITAGWTVDANNYLSLKMQNVTGTRKAYIGTKAGSNTANFNFANNTYYTWLANITTANIDFYYDYLVSPATKVSYANAEAGSAALFMRVFKNNTTNITGNFDYIGYCSYDSTVTTSSVGAEADLGPVINTVVPSSGYQGATVSVTITGANFEATPSVTFTKGAETITATGEHFTSSVQIECNVPIGVAETLGWWDCVVTNP